MDEMMDDMLEMDEDDEVEEEADAEVEKVLFEITDGKLGAAGSVQSELPVSPQSLSCHMKKGHILIHVSEPDCRGRRRGEELGAVPETTKRSFE